MATPFIVDEGREFRGCKELLEDYWTSLTQGLLAGIDDTAKVRSNRSNSSEETDERLRLRIYASSSACRGSAIAWLLSLVVPVRRRRMKLI